MDIAEKVSVKASGRLDKGSQGPLTPLKIERPAKADGEGFEIMANVIWEEFGRAIMDELGSVVFSVGRPDDFRQVCQNCFSYASC